MNVKQKVTKDTQIKIIRNAVLLNNEANSIKPLLDSLEYANKGQDYRSIRNRLKNTLKILKETPLKDKGAISNLIRFYLDNLTLRVQTSVILDLLEDSINNITTELKECSIRDISILEYQLSLQVEVYNICLRIERKTL